MEESDEIKKRYDKARIKKYRYKMKKIIYIILILISIGLGCIGEPKNEKPSDIANTSTTTVISTSIETPNATVISIPNATVITKINETIKCELCHTNPENIGQHINGGKLCVSCHGSQVHNLHTGAGTVNLDCNTCHGIPPKIPVVEKGTGPGHYIVCENCHAPPPNSLNSSLGNLIVIHLSRGKYCTNCHGTDIGLIHEAALNKSK